MTQALSFHDISSKSQPLKTPKPQIQGRTNWQECFVCVLMWRLSQNCGLGVGVGQIIIRTCHQHNVSNALSIYMTTTCHMLTI